MSNQTNPNSTAAGTPFPPAGAGQPPKNGSNNKIIIAVVIVVVVLCCICVSAAGVGTAAYFYLQKSPEINNQIETTPEIIEPTQSEESNPTPEVVEPTQGEEISPTPEIVYSPSETSLPGTPTNNKGLDVSRDDMIQFLVPFSFGQPKEIQGLEMVEGQDQSLCIQTNCAGATLAGPADDLLAVAVAVPTDPQDTGQTATAVALLMDVVQKFSGNNSAFPMQILSDLTQAQAAGNDFEKAIQENGYSFDENYDSQTHNAGVTITRPK